MRTLLAMGVVANGQRLATLIRAYAGHWNQSSRARSLASRGTHFHDKTMILKESLRVRLLTLP